MVQAGNESTGSLSSVPQSSATPTNSCSQVPIDVDVDVESPSVEVPKGRMKTPVKIEAASEYSTVDTLKQQYLLVPTEHKECYLVYILSEMSGSMSIVFTRSCDSTRRLALMLRNLGLRAIAINGHMSQARRLGALNKFKAGECNILVCTDISSRVLDISPVDLVINYDIPSNSKDYIHRVGRTAQAGRSGIAISIVDQYKLEWYLQIEKLIGKKLPEFLVEEEEVLLLLERVTEAKRIFAHGN